MEVPEKTKTRNAKISSNSTPRYIFEDENTMFENIHAPQCS